MDLVYRPLTELTEKLAKQSTTLKLMDEGKIVSEGGALTQIGMLISARTGGREALRANWSTSGVKTSGGRLPFISRGITSTWLAW